MTLWQLIADHAGRIAAVGAGLTADWQHLYSVGASGNWSGSEIISIPEISWTTSAPWPTTLP